MDSFSADTRVWQSSVAAASGAAGATIPANVALTTDAVGAAFNTKPVTYLSGVSTDKARHARALHRRPLDCCVPPRRSHDNTSGGPRCPLSKTRA